MAEPCQDQVLLSHGRREFGLLTLALTLGGCAVSSKQRTSRTANGSTLLVYFLSVESSYAQNVERAATSAQDTVQFLLAAGSAWRIKTFAIDSDVHIWSLGPMDQVSFEALAHSNTAKNYGDVLQRTVYLKGSPDLQSLTLAAANAGIGGFIEVDSTGTHGFWAPVAGAYQTRTTPRQSAP
jgi:hypothetical protein